MINKKKEMIDRLIAKIIEAIFYTLTLYTNERRIERRIVANHCWFQSTRIEILIYFKEFFFSPPGLSRLFRSFLSLSFSLSSFSICESVAYFFLIGRSHSRVQLPVSFEEKDRSVFIDVLHVRHTELHPPAPYGLFHPWIITLLFSWKQWILRGQGVIIIPSIGIQHFQDFSRIFFAIGLWLENEITRIIFNTAFNRKWRKCSFQLIIYYLESELFENILFLIINKLVENLRIENFWNFEKKKKTSLCKRFVEFKKERDIFFYI